jgi:hypothetical protein
MDKLKVPELRKLAKNRGFTGYSKLRKAELISLLSSSKCGSKKRVNPSSGRCVLLAPVPFESKRIGRSSNSKHGDRRGKIVDASVEKELDEIDERYPTLVKDFQRLYTAKFLNVDDHELFFRMRPLIAHREKLLMKTNPEQVLSELNNLVRLFDLRIKKGKEYNEIAYKETLERRDELRDKLGIPKSPRDSPRPKSPRVRGVKFDDPSDCPLEKRPRTASGGNCAYLGTSEYKTEKGFWCCK